MIKIDKDLEHATGRAEKGVAPSWDEIGRTADDQTQRVPQNPVGGQQRPSRTPSRISHPSDPRVMRPPGELKLYPALRKIDFSGVIDTDGAGPYDNSLAEPIIITRSGTILKGFGRWRSAILNGEPQILCLVSQVDEEDAAKAILMEHRPQCGWNDFIRISLALSEEERFREKAIENMSAGGRKKSATNLSEADRIDVALEIANLAGTGVGNVRKVKLILANAHPSVIAALQKGQVRIHRAWLWCRKSTKASQKIAFAHYLEKQYERTLLRGIVTPTVAGLFDQSPIMEAVERLAAWHNSIDVDLFRPKTSRVLCDKLPQAIDNKEEPIA